VYFLTTVLASSYLTKVGGCSSTAVPIFGLQETSKTVRLISSYSKSRARIRLASKRMVLFGLLKIASPSLAKESSVIYSNVNAFVKT
jgi:hypothetical protein